MLAACLRFFDTCLKGRDTGLKEEAPVHYFTMGEERWREAADWPPARAASWHFHFGAGGRLEQGAPAEPEECDVYRADYACGTGTSTRYERLAAQAVEHYYGDWHGRSKRMLAYTWAPLGRGLTLSGHPVATLHVAASERDAGLFVYLEDVAQDGTCRYVTEGIFRALHRKVSQAPANLRAVGPYHSFTRADAEPLVPGEPAEVAFALLPTSWHFTAGDRVRVSIAGADRDHFSRVPEGRPPELCFFRTAAHPSRIDLPVEP